MAKLAPAAAFAACSEAFAAAAAPAAVDISRRSCSTRRCRAAASSRRAASCHLHTPRCTHVCVCGGCWYHSQVDTLTSGPGLGNTTHCAQHVTTGCRGAHNPQGNHKAL